MRLYILVVIFMLCLLLLGSRRAFVVVELHRASNLYEESRLAVKFEFQIRKLQICPTRINSPAHSASATIPVMSNPKKLEKGP